ncbi:MAG: glycosyltransferase family 1 protein [Pedobacter sp.]|nr:MAG: glycosyltransferase family 1 protein [Pedobacter sp.]
MNIGLLTPYYPDNETKNSGIANHVLTLSQELVKQGQTVVIIHVRPKYNNERNKDSKEVLGAITILTYHVSLAPFTIKLFKKRWGILDFLLKIKMIFISAIKLHIIKKSYHLDIIETSSYFSLSLIYQYFSLKIPIVVRVSTTYLQMLNDHYHFKSRLLQFFGRLEILTIKRSKNLITHAHNHALELENIYGISSKRFSIIPHGVALPEKDKLSHLENSPLIILYVGRLEFRKGADLLLKAIPLVIQKCQDVIFEIIGKDPMNEYENPFRTINDDTVNRKVYFKGMLENDAVQKSYAECDIFVAPSRYESFGLIYIEAMSYGKAVIGCNVGGVPEIIQHEFNGLFAETQDYISLSDTLIKLIENKEFRYKLGKNARKTVEDRFSGETLAINSMKYYEAAILNY